MAGIFCLEADWHTDLRKRDSVAPVLDLLDRLQLAKSIRRDVATAEELEYYLKVWRQARYKDYNVLYIATHGTPDYIHLGRTKVGLDKLGDMLEGACQGRVVYLGGCQILNFDEEELKTFVKRIGAKSLVGYWKDADWLGVAAFELLLLTELAHSTRTPDLFKRLVKEHPVVAKKLGLVVATATQVFTAEGD